MQRTLPAGLSEIEVPSIVLARSSRMARRLAGVLLILLIATIVLMAFAPWQQTVTGAGFVVAYAPRERQQVLEATVEGRVGATPYARWLAALGLWPLILLVLAAIGASMAVGRGSRGRQPPRP